MPTKATFLSASPHAVSLITQNRSIKERKGKLKFALKFLSQNIEEVFGLRLQDKRLIVATADGFFILDLSSAGLGESG